MPTPEPAYDLAPLREMARNKEAFVHKIIHSFLANIPTSLSDLQAALAANDWAEVARVVHHIKPNLVALRIRGITEAVAVLEAVRHADKPQPPEKELRLQAAQLTAAVQRALDELPSELPAG